MSDRDKELDEILRPLRSSPVGEFQIRRWQGVVRRRPRRYLEWVAAALIGFLIGSFLFKGEKYQEVAQNFDPNATLETVYVKSE